MRPTRVLDVGPAREAAIWYAKYWDVRVAPADPRLKKPLITTGKGHAEFSSRDPKVIGAWPQFNQPGARVAIVTGPDSGVVVIEYDIKPDIDGKVSFHELERRLGPLPKTPQQQTKHGTHFVLQHPRGVHIKSTASAIAPGVDVRGYGGIIIAPPAPDRHWLCEAHPARVSLAELPPAWIDALTRDAKRTGGAPSTVTVEDRIPDGTRNATLASFAGVMRRRGISQNAILAALLVENAERCDPPLSEREVRQIARSVGRYEPAPAPLPNVTPALSTAILDAYLKAEKGAERAADAEVQR